MINTSAKAARRRLLILLLILIGIVIYSAGWRVTDISLEETQNPVRQGSLQRAMTELLSPDLLDQDSMAQTVDINFRNECSEDDPQGTTIEQPEVAEGQPSVVFSAYCGGRNHVITVTGTNFQPGALARVLMVRVSGNRQPLSLVGSDAADDSIFDIGTDGTFSVEVTVPTLRGSEGDNIEMQVEAQWLVGTPRISETTWVVLEKIIETIFLALMATTLAVPIAALLSFTAARNLMRRVTMPLGKVLIWFILIPIGYILGVLIYGPIGRLGTELATNADSEIVGILLALIVPTVAIVLFALLSRFVMQPKLKNNTAVRLRHSLLNAILLAAVILAIGAISGIALIIGRSLEQSNFYSFSFGILGENMQRVITFHSSDLGLVTRTLGELFSLIITLIAGLFGVFILPNIGTGLTADVLKNIRGTPSHVLGGVLGFVGGVILLALTGFLGSLVPLFTIIPPVAIAVLSMPILGSAYDRITGHNHRMDDSRLRSSITTIGGFVILFVAIQVLDVITIIAFERIPRAAIWQTFTILGQEVVISDYVARSALIGGILGAIGGAIGSTHASFPLGMTIYNTSRTILNIIRSIEPLIMGIVFVIWVGAGPFAGMLALGLHSIASLGKLYSEQIENIDQGPIEAIDATGANRLQTIIYAVVPQIIPPYIAFTMYRWDINVRMSTIIGFVGGGGIGFLLQQQINLLHYKEAGVAVLAIAIVVSLLDYTSASIRERII